ncbi:MAG: protease inhibitor I42 family protein [Bacilli bacterium]|nr:protease inhibitor I42 family protein [Bacilli bacterium]
MKKQFLLVLLLLGIIFCLILVCLKKMDINKRKNNQFIFSLYSNSSAGYQWKYEKSIENIIKINRTYDNSGCDKDADGCGGQDVYTIEALRPGTVTLNMKYVHVNGNTKYTAVYEFVIDDDLNISESHYGTYFEKDK